MKFNLPSQKNFISPKAPRIPICFCFSFETLFDNTFYSVTNFITFELLFHCSQEILLLEWIAIYCLYIVLCNNNEHTLFHKNIYSHDDYFTIAQCILSMVVVCFVFCFN